MTEESDLFCMLLSACRQGENISLMVFSYCSEDLKYVIIRNKLLRTDLFQGGREVLFLIRPSGRFMWKEWREHYGD